jgi:cell wall-associated NlpC family hydrolase
MLAKKQKSEVKGSVDFPWLPGCLSSAGLRSPSAAADTKAIVLRRTVIIFVVALACSSGPAAASGPVLFTVVPTPLDSTAAPADAAPATPSQLRYKRETLTRLRREERLQTNELVRAQRSAASAVVLSDQLDADKLVFQLKDERDASRARIDELQQDITALELELQTASSPAVDPFAPAPSTSIGQEAVMLAEQYLGVPYVWGGDNPLTGFDCSGLTKYVYAQLGVALPHYAAGQWSQGPQIDSYQLQPGDLVFFEPRADGPGHVGIYVGGDQFIEAPHTGDVVKLASLSEDAAALGFVGVTRPYALSTATSPFGY